MGTVFRRGCGRFKGCLPQVATSCHKLPAFRCALFAQEPEWFYCPSEANFEKTVTCEFDVVFQLPAGCIESGSVVL